MKGISKYAQRQVKRLSIKLEKPYPEDELIQSYKDFVDVRDCLHNYQFNPAVFESLLKLAVTAWNSTKRIDRLSIVTTIKRYGFRKPLGANRVNNYSKELNHHLFELFRLSFERESVLSLKQLPEVQRICNYMLIDAKLGAEELNWLLEHHDCSVRVLNRILRYSEKSPLITAWVKAHYDKSIFAERRAEATSWLLDETPTFEVSTETLLSDLNVVNQRDKYKMDSYEGKLVLHDAINEVNQGHESEIVLERTGYPSLELSRRHYPVQGDYSEKDGLFRVDTESTYQDYVEQIDYNKAATMLWAIAYSRLDYKVKCQRLNDYYSIETHYTFLKICERYKLSESVRWLLARQGKG